jgi:2-polyprenyl-6-methoxyphenol hydroxylase-like FAD-dependent oxidoreductase
MEACVVALCFKHGHPVTFLEGRMLMWILRENQQNKSKVHMPKVYVKVEQDHGGVQGKMQEGATQSGDLFIGEDGIQSTMRRHMHRLAYDPSPGYSDGDRHSHRWCSRATKRGHVASPDAVRGSLLV